MRHIFILNHFSIKDDETKLIEQIEQVSKRMGLDSVIQINSPYRPIEKIIDSYKDEENIIMCVGGDGTINRVLNGIVGTNSKLGFIPMGTGNDFYRVGSELFEDGLNPTDIVKINDKYFINVACFGIDADIANNLDNQDDTNKSYKSNILKHLFSYQPRHLKVSIDDEIYDQDFTTVILCNSRYYGGGSKVGTNALTNDGLIDVYLVDQMSKLKMTKLILGMNKAKHEKDKAVKVIKTKKVYIEADKQISCNIDGEVLTSDRFDVEVIPNGIDVYYNQDLIDEVLKVRGR